jgi:hypothetical protein
LSDWSHSHKASPSQGLHLPVEYRGKTTKVNKYTVGYLNI